MTPREMVRVAYNGHRNLMTPRVLGVGMLPGLGLFGKDGSPLWHGAYELSAGEFRGVKLWAVSVVMRGDDPWSASPVYNVSAVWETLAEARQHIDALRQRFAEAVAVAAVCDLLRDAGLRLPVAP